jgi:hypothetical protein
MKPELAQIITALPHVRYEIESLLLTPQHDKSNSALVESVCMRKMVHCRVLYSFFTISKDARDKRDDDVVCEDYEFPREDLYGANPRALLDEFNKRIFHLTYSRDRRPWDMKTLLPPVENQSRKFVSHIIRGNSLPIQIDEAEERCWRRLQQDISLGVSLQQNTSNVAIQQPFTLNLSSSAQSK